MATQTLSDKKIELIVEISKLENEQSVEQVKDFVERLRKNPTKKQLKKLAELSTTIKEKTDLDEIIREQNWKPTSKAEIDQILKDFDWQISDEDFIELLKNI